MAAFPFSVAGLFLVLGEIKNELIVTSEVWLKGKHNPCLPEAEID